MSEMNGANTEPGNNNYSGAIIGWGIASLVLTILWLTVSADRQVTQASFWAKTGAFLLAVPLGTIGALIGDAIRRFAAPSMVFTQGGIGSMIWIKLFWIFGPQCVGLVFGCAMGVVGVLK